MISPMGLYAIFDIIYISWPYTIWLIGGVVAMMVALIYLLVATYDTE